MGSVFTAEEVERRHVPSVENFPNAIELLKKRLRADPAIIAALLLGSVVRGDFNRRSDIDCMAVYETSQEHQAQMTLQAVTWECKQMYVTINFIPCDSETAKSGMHHFGPGFVGHLENSKNAGGVVKGDVVSKIGPTVTREEEAKTYVRSKLYNLEESYSQYSSFSNERKVGYLKKILEAPVHVVRKVVGMQGTLADDSKRAVIARYAEIAPPNLLNELNELVALDAWYTAEVDAVMQYFDRERYGACLQRIEAAIPKTVAFVRANALLLDASSEGQNQKGMSISPVV